MKNEDNIDHSKQEKKYVIADFFKADDCAIQYIENIFQSLKYKIISIENTTVQFCKKYFDIFFMTFDF